MGTRVISFPKDSLWDDFFNWQHCSSGNLFLENFSVRIDLRKKKNLSAHREEKEIRRSRCIFERRKLYSRSNPITFISAVGSSLNVGWRGKFQSLKLLEISKSLALTKVSYIFFISNRRKKKFFFFFLIISSSLSFRLRRKRLSFVVIRFSQEGFFLTLSFPSSRFRSPFCVLYKREGVEVVTVLL